MITGGELMSDSRKRKILEKLISMDTITTNDLAILFQVSSRTIRNDIKEINKDLSSIDAEIVLKPNKGAHLEMANQSDVSALLAVYQQDDLYTVEQRIEYIVSYLLLTKQYVTVSKLIRKLYISESQFALDMKKANKELLAYKLKITAKAKKGIYLSGLEKNKRRYLVDRIDDIFQSNRHYFLSNVVKKQLANGIEKIIRKANYDINDDMFDYLILHIMITMYRFELGFPIELKEEEYEALVDEKEYHIAVEIKNFIEKEFQCRLSEAEIIFITLQLLSKKRIQNDALSDVEIHDMIKTILHVIHEKFTIDFDSDEELKKSLYLHMMPLMNRIRYDLELRNPLISEIKMNYPLTYDLAGEVAVILNKKYGFKLKEDEIAYLSIHFNLALERYKSKRKKFKILFILSEGTSSSDLLKYKFTHMFEDYIKEINFLSPKRLEEINKNSYDLLISTHKLDERTYDYLFISRFLNEEDCRKITAYFSSLSNDLYLIDCISSKMFFTDIKADSKAEAILKICQKLVEILPNLDHLYDSIMERENLLTTELGNKVAFPHPLNPLGTTSFMSVTILDKPVLWDDQSVQIIFLSTIAKDNDKRLEAFYASFVEIVKDEMKITQLLSKKNFDTLLKLVNGKE